MNDDRKSLIDAKPKKKIKNDPRDRVWTAEELSVELENTGTNTITARSTREYERIDWLEFVIIPGNHAELPHSMYTLTTDDGQPFHVQARYGKEKLKYKN